MVANGNPRLVFAASNNHAPACGEPPNFRNVDRDRRYYGYVENRFGEQWVFVCDGEKKQGILRGGDTSWENAYSVRNGRAAEFVLNDSELQWLSACWKAVVARFGTEEE